MTFAVLRCGLNDFPFSYLAAAKSRGLASHERFDLVSKGEACVTFSEKFIVFIEIDSGEVNTIDSNLLKFKKPCSVSVSWALFL